MIKPPARGCIQDVEWRTTKYTLCKACSFLFTCLYGWCALNYMYCTFLISQLQELTGCQYGTLFICRPMHARTKSNGFPRRIARYDASIKSPR